MNRGIGGIMASAYVLLNMELGAEKETLTQLKEITGVKEMHRVYGVYDAVVKLEANSLENIKEMTSRIRRLSNIRSTLTMLVIE